MKSFCIVIFITCSYVLGAQSVNVKELDSINIEFLKHLKKEQLWKEGVHFLKPFPSSNYTNYYNGLFQYNLENIDSSIFYFSRVKKGVMFWDQARLLSSFQHSYQGSYEKALSILETYSPENKLYQGTSQLQQAGIALLQRDVSEFERLEQSFGNYYQLTPYEEVLSLSKKELAEIKPKSPFVAGLLSSIVPGAGRFYIGKPGEGIATLLVAGIFTAQTLEAYRKDGVRDPRFIIFGSLLSITYVSNIWGSVLAVKVSNLEKNNQINENILLNMHIPLRVIFD